MPQVLLQYRGWHNDTAGRHASISHTRPSRRSLYVSYYSFPTLLQIAHLSYFWSIFCFVLWG